MKNCHGLAMKQAIAWKKFQKQCSLKEKFQSGSSNVKNGNWKLEDGEWNPFSCAEDKAENSPEW